MWLRIKVGDTFYLYIYISWSPPRRPQLSYFVMKTYNLWRGMRCRSICSTYLGSLLSVALHFRESRPSCPLFSLLFRTCLVSRSISTSLRLENSTGLLILHPISPILLSSPRRSHPLTCLYTRPVPRVRISQDNGAVMVEFFIVVKDINNRWANFVFDDYE